MNIVLWLFLFGIWGIALISLVYTSLPNSENPLRGSNKGTTVKGTKSTWQVDKHTVFTANQLYEYYF